VEGGKKGNKGRLRAKNLGKKFQVERYFVVFLLHTGGWSGRRPLDGIPFNGGHRKRPTTPKNLRRRTAQPENWVLSKRSHPPKRMKATNEHTEGGYLRIGGGQTNERQRHLEHVGTNKERSKPRAKKKKGRKRGDRLAGWTGGEGLEVGTVVWGSQNDVDGNRDVEKIEAGP